MSAGHLAPGAIGSGQLLDPLRQLGLHRGGWADRRNASGAARHPPVDFPPMTQLDEHGRPEPPIAADEAATLLGFLEFQRATLAWKCEGLDAAGLRATLAPTS